jgi:hypothetical protein
MIPKIDFYLFIDTIIFKLLKCLVIEIVSNGRSLDDTSIFNKKTPLEIAIKNGNVEKVAMLLVMKTS